MRLQQRDEEVMAMEVNPQTEEHIRMREAMDHGHPVDLDYSQLHRIVRLRLISDPGYPMWDVSYCYGELKDGTPVRVDLPRYQFSKKNLKGDLIAMCKEVGVYGKGLGLFEPDVISTLV
jgi:hypothetical protein